jgi:hypothetical protein
MKNSNLLARRTSRVDIKVSKLIDPVTKKWNMRLFADLFSEEEAWTIANIHLCPAIATQ